jgi:TonB family protein
MLMIRSLNYYENECRNTLKYVFTPGVCIRLLIMILLLFSVSSYAQVDTVKSYYDNGKVKSEISYSKNILDGEAKFYYDNGNLRQELNYDNGEVSGLVKNYYPNGNLKETYNIEDGIRQGPASYFDTTGKYIADIEFKDGKLVPEAAAAPENKKSEVAENKQSEKKINKLIEKNQTVIKKKSDNLPIPPKAEEMNMENDPAIFRSAEIMPVPVDGTDAIQRKLVYPSLAKEKGIEGTVKVQVVINKYGDVTEAKVIQGIGYGCDESARIAVYYTKFKPALQKGKPVNIQMVIPVEFKLKKDEK